MRSEAQIKTKEWFILTKIFMACFLGNLFPFNITSSCYQLSAVHQQCTWGVQVLRSPNFFPRGMEADRNVKVVGGDVAVL